MSDADLTASETFHADRDKVMKSSMITMVILGVPLFLAVWLLFALICAALLKLPAPGLISALLAAAFVALTVWFRIRQLGRNIDSIELTLDPRGMAYTGDYANSFLSWGDIRDVQRVLPLRGIDAKKAVRGAGYSSIAASGGQVATNAAGELGSQLSAGSGVVGPGTLEVTGGAMARETHRQNAGRNGVDPETGQPYVAIPLSQFGMRWDEGRIGEWLARYRPDLVARAHEVAARAAGQKQPEAGQRPAQEEA